MSTFSPSEKRGPSLSLGEKNSEHRTSFETGWSRGAEPTPRELAVLNLICEGLSTKEIAYRLEISFKTAACHRFRLMEKAGVSNAVLLFRWALLKGYVTLAEPAVHLDATSATSRRLALSA